MAKSLYKFGVPKDEGDEAFLYPDTWDRVKTTGAERLIIAPSKGHIAILLELPECLCEPFWILYVLVDSFRGHEAARYQSLDPLNRAGLKAFLTKFQGFFESDARHHIWIGTVDGSGMLVYDQHNLLFAYGPLERYEKVIQGMGLKRQKVEIPSPHVHHFHHELGYEEDKLFSYWEWKKFPLQDGDDY